MRNLSRATAPRALLLTSGLLASSVAAATSWQDWSVMRQKVIGADALMSGEVTNGLNPVADVSDLVLSADGKRVQYLLYESSYPYTLYGGESGYVAYDRVEIVDDAIDDPDLIVDWSSDAPQAPDTLKLTRAQAQDRLASRLVGANVQFPSGAARAVSDILIDKKTGNVAAWVVEMDEDAIFGTERRALPAGSVSISGGTVSTSIRLADVDGQQQFDPALL